MKKLVSEYGIAWPRNAKNLKKIKKDLGKKTGVYVLTHGAMPMYVGKGQIAKRVKGHARPGSSKTKYWDHFSWFVLDNSGFEGQLEVIILRSLPFYVRSLNRQTGSLGKKNRIQPVPKCGPDWIKLPRLGHKRKTRKKKKKK
jgi:hypothetical protein